uniref:Fibronectin type-III domain-containing protein n=1 Tax=Candidatus Kentrum sp. FW TaxID=2126338 RepID=A0A450SKJ0_9GAMM|nr:MAG: hypothetical protein BECKFW1821B_GA0114236_10174 [Candidatus Kentron sp. FW]
MAKFPREEVKITNLGQEMSAGLKANADVFPSPPVDTTTLDELLASYVTVRDAAVAAQATAEQATAAKQEVVQTLAEKIKSNLRYAEMIVDFDDTKLKTIGWSGRREKSPLAPPGQVSGLVSVEEREGWIRLHWNKPKEGGKVAAYKVLCRERGSIEWKSADTAISAEIILTGQPRGKELEYCVVPINSAGEAPISNTIMAVL